MKPVSMIIRSFVAILFAAFATSALAITGAWTGAISDGTHNPQVVTYRFSPTGNPILKFASRNGWREIEVQGVGQRAQWLLPRSGYSTGVVEAFHVGQHHVQVVIAISTTSGGGNLLDQSERRVALDFRLGPNGLETVVAQESLNHSSGVGLGLYAGSRTRAVSQGMLQRID